MADIGGVSCDFVKGEASDLKQRVETYEVPGRSGYGAHTLGLKDSPFRFTGTKKHDTSANVDTWAASIQALQGTVVIIVDDWATSFTNLLITRVGQLRKTAGYDGSTHGAHGVIEVEGVKVS